MRKTHLSLAVLALVASVSATAFAQAPPSTQPKFLHIFREQVKPGRAADHAQWESGWPAAAEKAKSPYSYLALAAITGPLETWYVTPYASQAAYGESLAFDEAQPGLTTEYERLSKGDGEFLADANALQAVAVPEMSHGAYPDLANSKAHPLAQRDERALWDRFRTGCDAVFAARHEKHKEVVARKQEGRRSLEEVCLQLEGLARATEKDEKEVRATLRDLQDRWRARSRAPDPSLRALEGRFRGAVKSVEGALAARARTREAAVWKTLAEKEGLCEALESALLAGSGADSPEALQERWSALPELPPAWEKKMLARRDAALAALADPGAAGAHRQPVTDLKQGDFSLSDGGREEPISVFTAGKAKESGTKLMPLPAGTFSNRFDWSGPASSASR